VLQAYPSLKGVGIAAAGLSEGFAAARRAMEETEVDGRRQASMAPLLERRHLEEVFHLD
jgi:hypothetical protein